MNEPARFLHLNHTQHPPIGDSVAWVLRVSPFRNEYLLDKEWSDGKASPSLFCPTQLDTDQWVRALRNAGMRGAILTAKHHDGFCLWPSKLTNYTVALSPYRNGKGDIVGELSRSCAKYGLKFGIYLSPWDRHDERYGTPAYDEFYVGQLTELLTQYGKIFTVWLDGACGTYLDGKPKQAYDFDRYYETIRRLQPGCIISNCGPDVRWIGNESGITRRSEWNVVPRFAYDIQTIENNSQQADDPAFRKKGLISPIAILEAAGRWKGTMS